MANVLILNNRLKKLLFVQVNERYKLKGAARVKFQSKTKFSLNIKNSTYVLNKFSLSYLNKWFIRKTLKCLTFK
jgi:hypothetical protein